MNVKVIVEYDCGECGELCNQIDNLSDDLSTAQVERQDLEVTVSRQKLEIEELRAWKRREKSLLTEAAGRLESRRQECLALAMKIAAYEPVIRDCLSNDYTCPICDEGWVDGEKHTEDCTLPAAAAAMSSKANQP